MTNPDKHCGTCRYFAKDAPAIGRFGNCRWAQIQASEWAEKTPLRVADDLPACEEWEAPQ